MEILREDNGLSGKFYIEKDGRTVAEMIYQWFGQDKIIVKHTEVSEELQGMGVAGKLVEHAVLFARENGLKIIPHCPYTKKVLERTQEYGDVL